MADTLSYDPTVFVDPDDDTPYIVWGCDYGKWEGYYIARLNEDMISLAEKPRKIIVKNKPMGDDKSFLHKKNGVYYLSSGSFYATSKNVYGPYKHRGTIGVSEDHGSFFTWNGQDFNAFTIFDPNNYYRATGICYVHYRENGEMCADQLIAECGVGVYDANWHKIHAAWFMQGICVEKKENRWGGFDVCLNDKSEIYFPNIRNVKGKKKIHFLVVPTSGDIIIEIVDAKNEKVIGICEPILTEPYDSNRYLVYSCELNREIMDDIFDMKLRIRNDSKEALRIYWFKFTEQF